MLTDEQIANFREQILKQIDSDFPEDKKEITKQQIQSMTDDEFVLLLKQNHLINEEQNPQAQQCIFCSIANGQIQSYKIDENQEAIAILEINPISKAHTIVIPKQHVSPEQITESALTLAKQVAEKIKKNLQPKDIQLYTSNLFGHEIINVLPIYTDENQNSKRKQAKPEELEETQQKLTSPQKQEKPKTIKKIRTKNSKNVKILKRIP